MKIKRKVLIIVFITMHLLVKSQVAYKALKIGDTIPEISFEMLTPFKQTTALSDYRGKLLIIDCWNIYCSSCIKALPEFSSLKNKLGDQVNILALEGGSGEKKVMDFLDRKKLNGISITLPVAHMSDGKKNIFYQLFPILNYGFPVEIWVDEKGVLIGITSSHFVNGSTINKVLLGNNSSLTTKHYQKNFNKKSFLLINNNGGPDTAFTYRSMITPYIDSIPPGNDLTYEKSASFLRIFSANRTVSELIKMALFKTAAPPDNFNKLLELEVKDPSKFIRPKSNQDLYSLMKQRGYCYELILPPDRSLEEAFAFMRNDVERYFGIAVTLTNKDVKCLVLEKINGKLFSTKGGTPTYNVDYNDDNLNLKITNNSFSLVKSFIDNKDYPPIIDSTGISYPIDLDIKIPKEYNFEALKSEMQKAGIAISEKMITKEVVQISELKKSNTM